MPRSRGKTRRRYLIPVLAVGLAVAAWSLWFYPPVTDETGLNEQFDFTVADWATKRGLNPDQAALVRETRKERRHKWLHVKRSYWVPPKKRRSVLLGEVTRLAKSGGMKVNVETPAQGETVAIMTTQAGKETMRLVMRDQAFVAIVIDDLGYSPELARRVSALPCRLTCAIMPFTPSARIAATMALAGGKEIFIHMPMQPTYPLPNVPEYSILLKVGMDPAEVRARIRRAFDSLPAAVGVNNHEGSVATEDRVLMAEVAAEAKKRGLVFLDSKTTPKSVAWKVAREMGAKWERRVIFLDAEISVDFTEGAFRDMIRQARSRGEVIAIGHPRKSTLEVLERRIPEARRQGIEFVFASALARLY
jgi:polysaccharide deacetylase 2 family uncharacterized protein YibQ